MEVGRGRRDGGAGSSPPGIGNRITKWGVGNWVVGTMFHNNTTSVKNASRKYEECMTLTVLFDSVNLMRAWTADRGVFWKLTPNL